MVAPACTERNWVVLKGGQRWQNRQRTWGGCKQRGNSMAVKPSGITWRQKWRERDDELMRSCTSEERIQSDRDKRSGMCAGRRLPYPNLGSRHLKVRTVECVLLLLSSGHPTAWHMLNIFVSGSVENRKYTAATCVSTVIFVQHSKPFSQRYF